MTAISEWEFHLHVKFPFLNIQKHIIIKVYFNRCLLFQEGNSNIFQSETIGFLPHRHGRNGMSAKGEEVIRF